MNNMFHRLVFVFGVACAAPLWANDSALEPVQHEKLPLSSEDQALVDRRLAVLKECSVKVRRELDVDLEENPFNDEYSDALHRCMIEALNKISPQY